MEKLRKMCKKDFENNLMLAVCELLQCPIDEIAGYKFTVLPIMEDGKNYSSKDDIMRLWYFTKRNINRLFQLDEVVRLFSGLEPLYPLWIEVLLVDEKNNIIQLKHSLRFRRPSELHNTETGHPPFKVVINSSI